MKLPILIECIPYKSRLTEAACIDRYQKAQTIVQSGKGIPRGKLTVRNSIRRAALQFCRTCPVGRARMVCTQLEETG